jgi:hypothetical protein
MPMVANLILSLGLTERLLIMLKGFATVLTPENTAKPPIFLMNFLLCIVLMVE